MFEVMSIYIMPSDNDKQYLNCSKVQTFYRDLKYIYTYAT